MRYFHIPKLVQHLLSDIERLAFGLTMWSVLLLFIFVFSVIDVGSEWRTFSNEKSATDRSRVGAAEVRIILVVKSFKFLSCIY